MSGSFHALKCNYLLKVLLLVISTSVVPVELLAQTENESWFGVQLPPPFEPHESPVILGTGLLLPILLRYPSRLPLVKEVKGKAVILAQLMLASLGMFAAAHLFLFRLHLPNRYTIFLDLLHNICTTFV